MKHVFAILPCLPPGYVQIFLSVKDSDAFRTLENTDTLSEEFVDAVCYWLIEGFGTDYFTVYLFQ